MKLYRNAIILVVVLGLAVGGFFLASKNKKTVDSTEPDSTDEAVMLIEATAENLSEITTEKDGEKFILTKKDSEWAITFPSMSNYDKTQLDSVAGTVTYLESSQIIEEEAADLSKYGLDKPAKVTVKLTDGKVQVLEIGNMTDTESDYYVKKADSKKVYTLGYYSVDNLFLKRINLISKTIMPEKVEDIKSLSVSKDGKVIYSAKLGEGDEWQITEPIEWKASIEKISPILDTITKTTVFEYLEEDPSDLVQYGLDKPSYAIEVGTAAGKTTLLIGSDKVNGAEVYAKLATGKEVFSLSDSAINYVDKSATEMMMGFIYIPNIKDVTKVELDIDGQHYAGTITTDPGGDSEKDKFTFQGKDASMKSEDDKSLFREFYQSLIGITLNKVEIGAKPTGKSDLTITYYLKTAPNKVTIEYIAKDENYYYAMKDGVYTNVLVSAGKLKTDENVGGSIRDTLSNLLEAIK